MHRVPRAAPALALLTLAQEHEQPRPENERDTHQHHRARQFAPGVEQLLPRGRIAAVLEPQFVPAAEAELPGDAWVLGVTIDGVAKAYSLKLLNRHEVVNDRTGETAYAAVW